MTKAKTQTTDTTDELGGLNPEEYTFYAQNVTHCDADEGLLDAMNAWGKDN